MKEKYIIVLTLFSLLLFVRCFAAEEVNEVKVKEVISGDTIVLDTGEIIKLIGVSVPTDMQESKKDFFKKGAKELCWKLIKDNSRSVRLEYAEKKRDEYNNMLAYVYIDKLFLNTELIRRGFFTVPMDFSDEKYMEVYRSMEAEAKDQKRGIWADLTKQEERYAGAVVGNAKNRKYHKYDCKYVLLLSDSNKKKFMNQDEAISAGYSPCNCCRPDKRIISYAPSEGEDNEK